MARDDRAKNGVGLIVTGGIAPNRQGKLSPFAAKLTNPLEVRVCVCAFSGPHVTTRSLIKAVCIFTHRCECTGT